MNKISVFALNVGLSLLMVLNLHAEVSLCEKPNLPASSWHLLQDGINVALILSTRTEVGGAKQTQCLTIYINNSSNNNFFVNTNFYDSGVQVFYLTGQTSVPLHSWQDHDDDNSPLNQRYVAPAVIKPGQALQVQIDLSSQELILLKSHQVECSLPIYDASLRKKFSAMETSPQYLTEIGTK
jgi:hypothetical protein